LKYKVNGTIELNFEVVIEAENEVEAEKIGKMYAEDGNGLNIPTGETKVHLIEELACDKRTQAST